MKERCKNVWLAVSGIVISETGEWLVVKKKYSGLKDVWSLPAGFVKETETVDEAVLREVKEETGIDAEIIGIVGVRSGVIHDEISDNMLMFHLKPLHQNVVAQTEELYEAKFCHPDQLLAEGGTSILLEELISYNLSQTQTVREGVNPGNHFGYTKYKLFV